MTHAIQNEPPGQGRPQPDTAIASTNPQERLHRSALTRKEKTGLLRSRQHDVAEVAVAEEEGMQGPENEQMRDIRLASPNGWKARPTNRCRPTDSMAIPDTRKPGIDPTASCERAATGSAS